jgi:23S rRNA (cytidine2498-2'-O)-methyltransferase
MQTPGLLFYCRPGFEKECAAEVSTLFSDCGREGYAKTKPDSGLVLYVPHDPEVARNPPLGWCDFAFARQMVRDVRLVEGMPLTDRATPLADAAVEIDLRYSAVWLETADTNDAKELSSFCRKLEPRLGEALRKRSLLTNDLTKPRLHGLFLGPTAAYVGFTVPEDSSPWPMGIPRLRMPKSAASRSTLKLAEALLVFLDEHERAEWLHPGLSAVDLGAAPGGWTWQLVRHGLHVYAIDNGDLDPALLSNHQVEHIRADGFRWLPKRPVDWLVCDMIEQPARIATLVANWLLQEHCRRAVFNLKLPMKKRWDELQRCRELIDDVLHAHRYELRFKQLYHDREEVTGYLVAR